MLKLIGIIALATCPVILGINAALKLKTRVKSLRLLIRFIDFISSHISYESMLLQDIVVLAKRSNSFSELDFLNFNNSEHDIPFSGQIINSFEKSQKKLCFSDADFSVFSAFAEGLGSTDTEGQISHCALYKKSFESELEIARENEITRSKLYSSLGIFAGLFIVIMLF